MSKYEYIRFTRRGAVGELLLHRPEKRNAQTLQMWNELGHLGQHLLADAGDLSVVVVRGSGGCFSSGLDTSVFTSGELTTGAFDGAAIQQAFAWLRHGSFISVAAIEKFAIGAGLELALWCDMRLITEGSFVSLPEVEYGIIPDLGGCALLPDICGYAVAIDLITTARRVDAIEALQLNIVNEVVKPEELDGRLETLTTLLTKRSLTALRGAKRACLAALVDSRESLRVSQEEVTKCLNSLKKLHQS
jgi:enoyl-CoA hydratase/carnithine racemase